MVGVGVQKKIFEECASASHPSQSPPQPSSPEGISVFDAHILFMERKKQVELGRKKRVRVL